MTLKRRNQKQKQWRAQNDAQKRCSSYTFHYNSEGNKRDLITYKNSRTQQWRLFKVRIKSKSRLTSTEMAMTVMMTMATLPEPHKLPEEPWVEPQEALQEAPNQQASTSGWSRTKSRNSLAQRARTQFRRRILFADWRILPKQTGGWMHKPTTTLLTHSGIRLDNGYRRWLTGTTMSMINPCGQTSSIFSSWNTQFKQMKG